MATASASSTDGAKPKPWQSYHTVYTNSKAGMDGVDKEKVQRIVYEMSKGSKYFENEEKKEAIMRQKVESMRERCSKLAKDDLLRFQKEADKRTLELEATRDLSKIWLHVDMDAFYAAVETLSDPSLKGKPMAVGGMSMISTANYEARKFGVRAAMPGFIARKLCPELIFVPTDFKKYTHYSDLTRKVFQKYDPHFIAASLDEAYLDITEVCRERDITGGEIAEELRNRVYEETGLTCSAGVAPNRLLAKVCSDIKKPNGQFVLPNDRMAVMTFKSSLPIRKIGGIGKVTEHILKDALGINTCEELLQKGAYLCALFSRASADFFLSVGLGLGGTSTPEIRSRKSISSERTFSAINNEALLYQKLAEIAQMLSADMQKEGLCGRTLTLKLKTSSFEVRSKALTLQKYLSSSEDILKYGLKLLKAELPISLRLIGLRVSHFKESSEGSPLDPTQKTLTNFLSRDASRQASGDQSSENADVPSSSLCDTKIDFSSHGHALEDSDFGDPSHSDLWHCLMDNGFKGELCKSVASIDSEKVRTTEAASFNSEPHQMDVSTPAEAETLSPKHSEARNSEAETFSPKNDSSHGHALEDSEFGDPSHSDLWHCLMNSVFEGELCKSVASIDSEKVRTTEAASFNSEPHQMDVSTAAEAETFSPKHSETRNADLSNKILENDANNELDHRKQLVWIDDYKCSVCGIEMPTDFVEERQEHSDFHLAERLQNEGPTFGSKTFATSSRSDRTGKISIQTRGKKFKPSPKQGRTLPIDMFFVKSNQNF